MKILMSGFPHELIRQVQICTRQAAGLPDYNPSDPILPALPSLSAALATLDPSPPHLRCKNCKGRLLRRSDSLVCVYCGHGPQTDGVPESICFNSTIGYQWLLRSLRLDGSEMVELPKEKSERGKSQRSPSAPTRLSDFLNFKIQWPLEMEKQVASFSRRDSEESKRSLSLTGIAPDKFFLKSQTDVSSDMSVERPPFVHNQTGSDASTYVAPLENQNIFQNVQSSEPADSASKHETGEAFSEWEADFHSADFKDHQGSSKSSKQFSDSLAVPGNTFQDSRSFDISAGLEVDLSVHIDSAFGPGMDMNEEKENYNSAVSPAFDDWNSDNLWTNLSSNKLDNAGGFDVTISTEDNHDGEEYSKDLPSTGTDLFQDFQWQTSSTDMTENKIKNEEHKTMDEDSFEEWDDFMGPPSQQGPSQNSWTGSDQVSTSDRKFLDIDLFSLDNKSGGTDSSSFVQPNVCSNSISNGNVLTEVDAIMSENPASNWLTDASSPSYESCQAMSNEDAKSTKDDVMLLISQMHDLSFMLENELCIPSGPIAHSSSGKD